MSFDDEMDMIQRVRVFTNDEKEYSLNVSEVLEFISKAQGENLMDEYGNVDSLKNLSDDELENLMY